MTSPQINITAARLADLDAILALELSGFAESEQWTRRSWLGELLGQQRTVLLARASATVGVIALHTVGPVADLQRLVVAPRKRRCGIGSALVSSGLDAVGHLGARSAMLEVHYGNEPAIALYQRMGFEQLTVRENYYGQGQHALILKRYDLAGPAGRQP